jgi:hypothetical protein
MSGRPLDDLTLRAQLVRRADHAPLDTSDAARVLAAVRGEAVRPRRRAWSATVGSGVHLRTVHPSRRRLIAADPPVPRHVTTTETRDETCHRDGRLTGPETNHAPGVARLRRAATLGGRRLAGARALP